MGNILERVETTGGKVIMPKISIGVHVNIAFIVGTEGNHVGIHPTS